MSHLRHVDSRSLHVSRLNGDEPGSFALESHAGQQTLAGFIAEASAEVVALRTAGGRTQAVTFLTADHAKEKLLPFHVLRIAASQGCKVPLHQAGQLGSICEAQILPEMIWPNCSAGNENGQKRSKQSGDGARAPQQLPQAPLILVHYWLAVEATSLQPIHGSGKVPLDVTPKLGTPNAESARERTAGPTLNNAGSKDARKHMPIEWVARSGSVRLSQIRIGVVWRHG